MSMTPDWYPGTRIGQLAMGKKWVAIMATHGTDWGIPGAVVTGLGAEVSSADSVLAAAMNESTRTPVVTAHCREIFGFLEGMMRDIKRRYFLIPPLTEADFVALGLKIPDSTSTPTGTPTAQVTVETFLAGRHELGFKIVYVTGSPDDAANKEYRVYYKVVGPGEKAPEHPKELGSSFSTKRKKELIRFDYGESGKTVYIAVQIENERKKGEWGPMVSALIP
jgi:hypothetical protein